MERMTRWNPETEEAECEIDGVVHTGSITTRLAEYEDTWLEPEQCAKYAQAEQEGRLLVLPCKVGDMVWAFWDVPTSSRYVIYSAEVKEIKIGKKRFESDISVLLEPVDFRGRRKEYGEDDFGKTVFLTREDAEKALEGMNNDER